MPQLSQTGFADLARDSFVAAMRQAATGVTVVTTAGMAGRLGVTVSAMSSVSAEPPLLLVCVHRGSPVCEAILENGSFCVNILHENQRNISDVFAGQIRSEIGSRFDYGSWLSLVTGAPALNDAAAAFDCRVEASHDHGTHRVFVGRVVESRCGEGRPLVYCDRSYGSLALH